MGSANRIINSLRLVIALIVNLAALHPRHSSVVIRTRTRAPPCLSLFLLFPLLSVTRASTSCASKSASFDISRQALDTTSERASGRPTNRPTDLPALLRYNYSASVVIAFKYLNECSIDIPVLSLGRAHRRSFPSLAVPFPSNPFLSAQQSGLPSTFS